MQKQFTFRPRCIHTSQKTGLQISCESPFKGEGSLRKEGRGDCTQEGPGAKNSVDNENISICCYYVFSLSFVQDVIIGAHLPFIEIKKREEAFGYFIQQLIFDGYFGSCCWANNPFRRFISFDRNYRGMILRISLLCGDEL
jgi:hypothetical protein